MAGQAIEHALADMLAAIELARAAVYQAVRAVAERDGAGHAASSAKAAMGECQALVTRQAIEIVGAAAPSATCACGSGPADDLLFGSAADHRRIVADHSLSSRRAWTSQPRQRPAGLECWPQARRRRQRAGAT